MEDNKVIGKMESYYLRHKRRKLYIPLEDINDWVWDEEEVIEFDWLWNQDKPLKEIAKEMERSEVSIFLLAFDRLLNEKIEPRDGWNIW